jgi:adenine deaminase
VRVFKSGIEVAREGELLLDPGSWDMPPMPGSPMRIEGIEPEQLRVPAEAGKLRVIGLMEATLFTQKLLMDPRVENGCVVCDPGRDLLKAVVYNRYVPGRPPAVGFVHGLGLKKGAVATSVAHDSHNVVAAGVSDSDIAAAVSALKETGGGMAAVLDGHAEVLPLPIAGLMSPLPARDISDRLKLLKALLRDWGAKLENPFMALSFLSLPVIPELKLTDLGIVEVSSFSHVPLFEQA